MWELLKGAKREERTRAEVSISPDKSTSMAILSAKSECVFKKFQITKFAEFMKKIY